MRWLPLLVVVACSHPKPAAEPANTAPAVVAPAPPAAAKPPIRLFTDAEIDTAVTGVLARIAENGKHGCPAPKLLADATPGSATPELLALFEGQGALADCMARLGKLNRDDFVNHTPEVGAVDKDCAEPIAAAVHKAGAFEDGCSPYQVGVHADPKERMRPMLIARLLATRAANTAIPATGINMLIDVLRMAQDLARGHVTLVSSMIAVATTEIAAEPLDALLETAKLKPAQLDSLAATLDRLIAAVPAFHEVLEGERESQELFAIMLVEPADWVPPGGAWDFRPSHGEGKAIADPRDEGGAMLFAAEVNAEDRAKACPPNASLEACMRGLGAMPQHATGDLDVMALWKQGQTDEPGMRLRIRQQIIETLAGVAAPTFTPYAAKQASMIQRLAELRIHVEMLRTHKCPPPYPAPESLGKPLDVHAENRVVTVEKWQIKCH